MNRTNARLATELRARLADIFAAKVSDPRLAGAMIIEVQPAPDLSYARVYFRTLADPAAALAALEKAGPFIRRELGARLKMRRVPVLDFRIDETPDKAARVDAILREIAVDEPASDTPETSDLADADTAPEGCP